MMKVKDLLEQEVSIDVYDNVCEELAIAFEGPVELTDEGKEHFAEALEFEIYLNDDSVSVDVDDEDEDEFERKLKLAKELFEGMAGYCSVDEWKQWFKEEI